jgi:predicted acylesterase/phospholipase RssA
MPKAGESSFVLDAMILSEREQRTAARCLEDIVVYDYRVGKKIALRPFMLDAFEEIYRQQAEAKERNTRRVLKILDDVRQLEKDTWDKPDAKEDMGGT